MRLGTRLRLERENGWILFHSTAGTLGEDKPPHELREALDHLEWARAKAPAGPIGQFASIAAVRIQGADARTATRAAAISR